MSTRTKKEGDNATPRANMVSTFRPHLRLHLQHDFSLIAQKHLSASVFQVPLSWKLSWLKQQLCIEEESFPT